MSTNTFNGFYFCWKDAEYKKKYKVVKFGDTRKESQNAKNYRGRGVNIILMYHHGNQQVLVENNAAVRIGGTESYVVSESLFKTLRKNCLSVISEKNFISKHNIQELLNKKVYTGEKRFIDKTLAKKLKKEKEFK
eukprot:gene12978-7635_t